MKNKTDVELALQVMTPVQRRRYRLIIRGYTQTEIASLEGVSQQAVCKSLKKAKKTARNKLVGL